ncbi:MAG: hypothetical protein LQ350_001590 [Teloschistes chrysophthalmus]|nr:MAG: hypothetical protein LQ350_001590 [Niorma chrysophthalma]
MANLSSSPVSSLPPLPLPAGLRERQLPGNPSTLSYHLIEAGTQDFPLLILLHGFPELAYSWRKLMPLLAEAGYYVVAYDQRGFGRTTNWDTRPFHKVDLNTFTQTTLRNDVITLMERLGYHQVECVMGHDFGCVPAHLCALSRPDMFKKTVIMGHPFFGIPTAEEKSRPSPFDPPSNLKEDLAKLPQPKKHYRHYYSTASASAEMSPPSGMKEFLGGYFHLKSADPLHNDLQPITAMTAEELNKLPSYYLMPLHLGMRDTIAQSMTSEEKSNMHLHQPRWLPPSDVQVYADEWSRTGFQGGLNWYRVATDAELMRKDLQGLEGKRIEIPCLYVVGVKDWILHQNVDTVARMRRACQRFEGPVMVEGAGHWVQQERPEKVAEEVLRFLRGA